MAQDDTQRDPHTTSTPPDRAAQGDVSTTGHSTYDAQGPAPDTHGDHDDHDAQDAHASHDAHGAGDAHGGHGGHGADTSDVSTLVPTTWRQLVLPALILLLVLLLVSGPIMNAFAYRPAAGPETEQTEPAHDGEGALPETTPTTLALVDSTATTALAPTRTTAPTSAATATSAGATATLSPGDRLSPTQTAVADAGQRGIVARVPVELNFAGTTFVVAAGDTLLPDWEPSTDPATATWIEGTVANHVLYVPYSEENLTLFTASKPGDMLRLTMNTGQVFEFEVNRAERVANGPPTEDGQFTVTTAMSQDHAGVTLFLIGDPAPDRAVLQAEFTGNIQ
ncbi:MAG: hypothetical protein M3441_04755 [Chloroflexota bacterium]|nr:hypothetical protein [Chloroflexota bacterium]